MKHIQAISVANPAKADEKGYLIGCGLLKNALGKCGPVELG